VPRCSNNERIPPADGAEQILPLVKKLFERGTDGPSDSIAQTVSTLVDTVLSWRPLWLTPA